MSKDTEKTRLVRRPKDTSQHAQGHQDASTDRIMPGVDSKTKILSASNTHESELENADYSQPENTGPVVGFVVVLDGPGKGQFRGIYNGMNSLGRGAEQRIPINFGDETISRDEHAYITYDDEGRSFFVQHGGRANLVRLNGKPVLQSLAIKSGDTIRIGKTELKFLPLCGPEFDWKDQVENTV